MHFENISQSRANRLAARSLDIYEKREVSTRLRKASDDGLPFGIATEGDDNRNGRCRLFGRPYGRAERDDDLNLARDQLGS